MVMIDLEEKILTIDQLKSIVNLAEHQKSDEKFTNKSIIIPGAYYNVVADIDNEGDITIMED